MYVRSQWRTDRWFSGGARFEFRDDDRSGGRAQVLSGGVETIVAPLDGVSPVSPYVPLHLAVDLQHVAGRPSSVAGSRSEWPRTGVYPRLGAGVGVRFGSGDGGLWVEHRWSWSSGGDYRAVSVGFGGATDGWSPGGSRLMLMGHELFPAGGAYRREDDYRGYTVRYQHAASGFFDAWRWSFGIDFLDFTYSTGFLGLFVGPAKELVHAGPLLVRVEGRVGSLYFFEGGNAEFPWGGTLGVEGEVALGSVALIVGAGVVGANGPVGWIAALQPRFGVAVPM